MADSKAEAPFVFEGSVKSLATSNVPAVPADTRTVIVQVDHVRHAPRALAGFAGKDVTVRMAPNEKVSTGEKAVFFTDSLVFADQLAVQSMGHDPVVALEARASHTSATPVVQKLRQRIDQATSIVSGKVAAIRPPRPASKSAAAAASEASTERISEHAPFWQEAVIDVSQVHKGPKQKRVVVRFPSSTDVKWRLAPRFKQGQQGTWLLHSGPTTATGLTTRGTVGPAAPAGVYTALDPNDFQPASEASVVKAMLPVGGGRAAKPSRAKTAAPKKTTKAPTKGKKGTTRRKKKTTTPRGRATRGPRRRS